MPHVLIIEDDIDISHLFSLTLEIGGHSTDRALSGTDGMRKINECLPDAIILDLHLPGVSGDDIYETLYSRNLHQRVLICSADKQAVSEYQARGARAVEKPFSLTQLNTYINQIANQVMS